MDAVGLVTAMKRSAVDAVEAAKPMNICFGTVLTVGPLTIDIEQKLPITEAQIVLTRNVTDFITNVTVNWLTENALADHSHAVSGNTNSAGDPSHSHSVNFISGLTNLIHQHGIIGKKEIIIHNALVPGDQVILLREQGGQRFIVLDRIGAVTGGAVT